MDIQVLNTLLDYLINDWYIHIKSSEIFDFNCLNQGAAKIGLFESTFLANICIHFYDLIEVFISMKSHVIWSNLDVFALFLTTLDFQAVKHEIFDPKPLQKVSLIHFRKIQGFSGQVSVKFFSSYSYFRVGGGGKAPPSLGLNNNYSFPFLCIIYIIHTISGPPFARCNIYISIYFFI